MVSIFELNGMLMRIIRLDHQQLLTNMFIGKFSKIFYDVLNLTGEIDLFE